MIRTLLRYADLGTWAFWGLIALLLGMAVFFGVQAEKGRRSVQNAKGTIDSGNLVRLVEVIDGDTVLVAAEGQEPVTVRILGIKSFDAKVEKDAVTAYAQAAVEALRQIMADRPVRVMLNAPPRDRYGRTLATLYAGDDDVGLTLVQRGLVLVYTVYPFPGMPVYRHEQEVARRARRGLWASSTSAERAQALMREWQVQAP